MDIINTQDWEGKILAVQTTEELEVLQQSLFGRKKGVITVAMKGLKDCAPEQRKDKAAVLNKTKQSLQAALDQRNSELQNPDEETIMNKEGLDTTLPLPPRATGHLHLIPEFITNVEELFGRMGFDTFDGPELESEDLNFDALNIPATHAARDGHDTFWTKNHGNKDGKEYLLRTHTSPCQIRYMQTHTPPFRAIFPGKVYRKDADATHSPMFHQFEGLMIGQDITLANMKAVMMTAIRELIDPAIEFRFRTGYFPFVEPGLEVDMRWPGDEKDSREGPWLEIVGCGMVHPNVLKNVGIDSTKYRGFAFGFGVERMIMIKHRIPDLRLLYDAKLEFLHQF